jgi:hypothetical protein
MHQPMRGGAHAAEVPDSPATLLMRQAQQVADELRLHAEGEARELTEQARVREAEASRLYDLAQIERDDTARALRQAERQHAVASEEARQLVADAADQATLLIRTAEAQAQSILADTERLASARVAEADVDVEVARRDGDRLRDEARAAADSLLLEARQRAEQDDAATREAMFQRTQEAAAEAVAVVAHATTHATKVRQAAEEEAARMRDAAAGLLEAARQEAIAATRETLERNDALTEEAQLNAQRELAAASEQMSWTISTVKQLIATADLESARIKRAGHATAGNHVRRMRQQVGEITSRLRGRLADEAASHERSALALAAAADHVRQAADEDARRSRESAHAAARRLREDAENLSAEAQDRAQRRLDEAERGARILGETVVTEVIRIQREAQDESRRLREEATAYLSDARTEADQLRAQARRSLDEAREEITILGRRRDEITAELGQLSGVIQALSVPAIPDRPTRQEEDRPQ